MGAPLGYGRHRWRGFSALVLAGFALGACGSETSVDVSGPTTASSTIVDLPGGPVSGSAATLEARLNAAGVAVTAIDRENGFIQARTTDTAFVDCGRVTERVSGRTQTHDGNTPVLVLADPERPGSTVTRRVSAVTSAGIAVTQGRRNTVVVRQQHQVTVTVSSNFTGGVLSSETREFTDRGFASFADGTVCRSSNAMNRALQ